MRILKRLPALAVMVTLNDCGIAVPPEKSAYVGEWQHPQMVLSLTQDSSVDYQRCEGNKTTSVSAPLKKFDGNNFEVGVGPMSTVFVVSKPPYQVDGQWKMVVDGVELTRTRGLERK